MSTTLPRKLSAMVKTSSLDLNGAAWALDSSMRDLARACRSTFKRNGKEKAAPSVAFSPLTSVRLEEFDLDTMAAAKVIQLFQTHATSLQNLTIYECTGHVDLVLTVALTSLPKLKSLRIATGKISTTAFDPCANALGVGLQTNQTLKFLTLQSGSNVFFTLSSEAAQNLADGLAENCLLERFDLVGCRFAEPSTLPCLARGLRKHCFLKRVRIESCFQSNGHALEDSALSELIRALGLHNRQLQYLDLTGNQCLSSGIMAVSKILDRTALVSLNLSCQCILTTSDIVGRRGVPVGSLDENEEEEEDEENRLVETSSTSFLNLSFLVGALGRTNSLKDLELRFNQLVDTDMAYLAAALTHNTSIRYVGLSSNRISNLGLSILASRIPNMTGLKRMVLTNNQYDNQGLAELAVALKNNFTIESMELDPCKQAWPRESKRCPPWRVIRHYTDMNWAGRRYLERQRMSLGMTATIWALVFARTTSHFATKSDGDERQASILYEFLKQSPILFPV